MQDLLPQTSEFSVSGADTLAKKPRVKRVKTEAESWAERWTTEQLAEFQRVSLPDLTLPKRLTKLWLAGEFVSHGLKEPQVPRARAAALAKRQLLSMGEPTELAVEPEPGQPDARRVVGTDLILDNGGKVVGAIREGILVNLSRADTELAIGLRLPLDMFYIERIKADMPGELELSDPESDDEPMGL